MKQSPEIRHPDLGNLAFENLTLGGKIVRFPDFFTLNEFVDGLSFAPSAVSKP
jgi:hypothetical protein